MGSGVVGIGDKYFMKENLDEAKEFRNRGCRRGNGEG